MRFEILGFLFVIILFVYSSLAFASEWDVLPKGTQYCADTYTAGDGYPNHPNWNVWGSTNVSWIADINFPGDEGTALHAPEKGKVKIATTGYGGGWGNSIIWTSENGTEDLHLAHLKDFGETGGVNVGDVINVDAGDIIGHLGSTGLSTNPHLHISRRYNQNNAPVVVSGVQISPAIDPAIYGKWPCNSSTYVSKGYSSLEFPGSLEEFPWILFNTLHVSPNIVPTIVSKTGRVWMDRNLGASRVAISFDDEQAYGDLYQWGRGKDGHEKRNSESITTSISSNIPGHGLYIYSDSFYRDWRVPQNDNLWQGVSGINNPCPSGFRIPTAAEWQIELNSWSSKDNAGAFGSPLKLVAAGFRSTVMFDEIWTWDVYGSNYWSSTVSVSTDWYNGSKRVSGNLYFDADMANISSSDREYAFSVRCIKD